MFSSFFQQRATVYLPQGKGFNKLTSTSQFPLYCFLPKMPKCFVQCVVCMYKYIYIYILEIDITSETLRSNVLASHSFLM